MGEWHRGLLALASLGLWAGWQATRLHSARRRTDRALRFRHAPDEPRHCVVIAGDSTAVGVGASNPGLSIGGRLAYAVTDARIVNVARSGARLRDVPHQLQRVLATVQASVCVVLCGINDVLRFTSARQARAHAQALIDAARVARVPLVLVPPAHVGDAPLWLPPWSWLFSWRARQVRNAVFEAARGDPAVETVDLALPRQRDPFAQDPAGHYAPDRMHPNANGYGRWFECLLQHSRVIQRHLAPARQAAVMAHPAHRLFR